MPARFGVYEILAMIGQGGAGTVYRARSPGGEVALKVLRKADAPAFARFERERRLQSALGEQEGFLPLLDAGVAPEGPYLVMPFAGGGTLAARLARGRLAIDETITLGRTLARALGRAHESAIVHRDLKPDNVLFMADGRALVADLGLAKHFATSGASVSLSRTGELRGTTGYMAPEQLQDSKSAGPAADVFALGAVLYECLTGVPAFAGESVVEVLARVARGEHTPVRELRPETPRWLADVIARALQPSPAARFADARALAAALERRAGGAPRRMGLLLPALALVATAVAATLVAVTSPPRRPVAPPAAPAPVVTATPASVGGVTSLAASWVRPIAVIGETHGRNASWTTGVAFAPDGKLAYSSSADRTVRAWDVAAALRGEGLVEQRTVATLGEGLTAFALAPNGREALVGGAGGGLWLLDLATGRTVATLAGHTKLVSALAFLPDGDRALSGGEDAALLTWDLRAARRGERVEAVPFGGDGPGQIRSIAVAPTGRVAAAVGDSYSRIVDLETGKSIREVDQRGPKEAKRAVVFARAGLHLIEGDVRGTVMEWDVASGDRIATLPALPRAGGVHAIAVLPEDRGVLTLDEVALRLWKEMGAKDPRASLATTSDPQLAAAVSRDGRLAVTGGSTGSVRLWDLQALKEVDGPGWHPGPIVQMQTSQDGNRLLASFQDRSIRLLDTANGRELANLPAEARCAALALSSDQRWAAIALEGKRTPVRLWDLAAAERRVPTTPLAVPTPESGVVDLALSPDASRAVIGSDGPTAWLVARDVATPLATFEHAEKLTGVDLAPDGQHVLTVSRRRLKVWPVEPTDAERPCEFIYRATEREPTAEFMPDGRVLLSDGKVTIVFDPRAPSPDSPRYPAIHSVGCFSRSLLRVDGGLRILDLTGFMSKALDPVEIGFLPAASMPRDLLMALLTKDGRRLIVATGRGQLVIRDLGAR